MSHNTMIKLDNDVVLCGNGKAGDIATSDIQLQRDTVLVITHKAHKINSLFYIFAYLERLS